MPAGGKNLQGFHIQIVGGSAVPFPENDVNGQMVVLQYIFVILLAVGTVEIIENDQKKTWQHESLGQHNAHQQKNYCKNNHGHAEKTCHGFWFPCYLCYNPVIVHMILLLFKIYQISYQFSLRNSRGVTPVVFLNMAIKWLVSENPVSPAICCTSMRGLDTRNSLALLMRRVVRYS